MEGSRRSTARDVQGRTMIEKNGDTVTLKEYIEAVLDEQRRGLIVAEQEREKSAAALRAELTRQIEQGDTALREHIFQQIAQIRAALEQMERLSMARLDSLRRESELIASAAADAISKAEAANEKRFESVNEFRAQLGDQTNSFMPREVADAQFADVRRSIADLAEKVGKLV